MKRIAQRGTPKKTNRMVVKKRNCPGSADMLCSARLGAGSTKLTKSQMRNRASDRQNDTIKRLFTDPCLIQLKGYLFAKPLVSGDPEQYPH
jgi:hypothetical protein